ncbi:MAG: ribonuclease HI family protein [Armatimonadetes bacterium]|nr:ribonuclease HI family protein [Armatimonadota bacterium]
MPEDLQIYFDGAARGNPGPSGIGVVVYDDSGNLLHEFNDYLGILTNNQAEYRGFQRALEEARNLGAKRLQVFSDSELVVKQFNGVYRVKHEALISLYRTVKKLSNEFARVEVTHVPRERNRNADRLANRAIDDVSSEGDQ